MKTALILLGHITFDAAFGWTLLNLRPHQRTAIETLLAAILLGMYVETLSVATLMFVGLRFATAGLATALAMAILVAAAFHRSLNRFPAFSIEQPKWYEWAALVAAGEKILFATWQLARFHTYFDDALMHWSGRARSLFGSVNWSMDPGSPFFMGRYIGNSNYPLLTVVWRALSAKVNGDWNEVISRADGLIFFIVIVGTVWAAVWKFSKTRWLAAAAAFIVSAVPLQAWHAAAGYSDIALEAFLVAALAAVLRGEWLTGGVLAAGAVWSKNDGLVLYVPSLLVAVLLIQMRPGKNASKWRNVAFFVSGFVTVTPWLVFNYAHSLGITPGQHQLAWHSDAPKLLWNAFFTSASSGILWTCMLLCAIYTCVAMFKDKLGRALILSFSVIFLAMGFVFTSTSAYAFLADETTIHRVLMQFSATAIVIVTYGLSLKMTYGKEPQRPEGARKRRR